MLLLYYKPRKEKYQNKVISHVGCDFSHHFTREICVQCKTASNLFNTCKPVVLKLPQILAYHPPSAFCLPPPVRRRYLCAYKALFVLTFLRKYVKIRAYLAIEKHYAPAGTGYSGIPHESGKPPKPNLIVRKYSMSKIRLRRNG